MHLNILLDVVDKVSTFKEIDARQEQVIALLGRCIHDRADFRRAGRVFHRLVVGMQAEGVEHAALHNLAVAIGQACVAVYCPEQGLGVLVGPGADYWGAFDLTKFQRLDERKAADEEMARAFGFA